MKHRTHKPTAKAVAAILCATLMLTACGSKETANTETTSVTAAEATSVESTETTVAEPTTEPTVEPAETPTESEAAPTETPAESPAPAVEPTAASVEPTAASVEPTAVSTGYTYSELSQTMYAKSAVNIRDLPSTDGKKIGSLKASEEITVTGKCDQTGWYRFKLNNTTGYVSDRYIVSEKPAVNTAAATGNNSAAGNQYASNTVDDTFGITEEQIENFMKTHGDGATGNTTTTTSKDAYFDRAMAEQVFAMVNAERSAAGIPELAWSEDLYNLAVERCNADNGHTGATTAENYQAGQPDEVSASFIHQKWHDSQGHYNNYMDSRHVAGAVAIKRIPLNMGGLDVNDTIVAYEVFTNADSSVASCTEPIVTENTVAAAPKTADENTDTSSSNVGWSMTPPTQEDGLKKWQEQNPDVEVSFGN